VLLVDGDPETQQLIRLALRRRCEVLVASSAAEARGQLAAHPGEIRMILIDLVLAKPGDGLTLTRQLRRTVPWRKIPIVAETAHAGADDRLAALRAGCDEFLAKPFYARDLHSIVDRYLERQPRS
jgi:two-component system KDP operon response regulator KdpE